MKKLLALLSVAVFALVLTPGPAPALTYNLNFVFSGDTPTGSPPWMQANITNIAGGVHVDLVNMLKSSLEFASEVSLNVNPALNATSFTYSALNPVASAGTISTGVDAFKADGDGYFDILFSFPTAEGPDRFTMGETASYSILGAGLDETDFAFLSAPDGAGAGLYYAAAHIQGIPDDGEGSSWIGATGPEVPPEPIPEPATLILLGSGMLAGLWRSRKSK